MQSTYENWEEIYAKWQSDGDWWGMIRWAGGGDMIFGGTGGKAFAYELVGSGQDLLRGLSGPYELEELRSGRAIVNERMVGGSRVYDQVSIEWAGTVRELYAEDDARVFYPRPGYTVEKWTANDLDRFMLGFGFLGWGTMLSAVGGYVGTALGVSSKVATLVGLTVDVGGLLVDPVDQSGYGPNDRKVFVGPVEFWISHNSQGPGWNLDSLRWNENRR